MDLDKLAQDIAALQASAAESIIYREAVDALFATHPNPAALRKAFEASAGGLVVQAENSTTPDAQVETMRGAYEALLWTIPDAS